MVPTVVLEAEVVEDLLPKLVLAEAVLLIKERMAGMVKVVMQLAMTKLLEVEAALEQLGRTLLQVLAETVVLV